MPRPKTGAAHPVVENVNGKRVKEWYACVSYTDDSGVASTMDGKSDE